MLAHIPETVPSSPMSGATDESTFRNKMRLSTPPMSSILSRGKIFFASCGSSREVIKFLSAASKSSSESHTLFILESLMHTPTPE